jgi:hypothetical protein
MNHLSKFLRNVPGPQLRDYFEAKGIELPDDIDWDGGNQGRYGRLKALTDGLHPEIRAGLTVEIERIIAMGSEAGDAALMSLATSEQRPILVEIASPHTRALWFFQNDFPRFLHAERSSSFDQARTGQTWDAYGAPIDLDVAREDARLEALAVELSNFFRADGDVRVLVEVFDRNAPDEDDACLVQVVVLREGTLVSPLVFLPHRPVGEIGFTYNPTRGVIEVVAKGRDKHEGLVRSFSRTLLGRELDPERLPIRPYDLSVFMTDRQFSTDPNDQITSVKVRLVTFVANDGMTSVTIEGKNPNESVHAAAERLFRERNPFLGGFSINEVILSVRFQPDRQNPRGKTVSVKLRHPHGCSIGESCAKERLIRRKYLSAWGVAAGAEIAD